MLQMAVDRLVGILPSEKILLVTTEDLADELAEQAPEIPAKNFVLEPQGRGTAPAIALGALYAEWLAGGEAVIICLTADHYIRNIERFHNVLQAAVQVAEQGAIVTLGITPTFPSTGYGYIQAGDLQMEMGSFSVYDAVRFREKPDSGLAAQFLSDGKHTWNSGMFIWTTSRVRDEFERQLPEMARRLHQINKSLGTPQQGDALANIWPGIPKQTIDYGIMEGAMNVSVIPVELGWSDVGSWASLLKIVESDENGNVLLSGKHQAVDTRNTLVYAKRLVGTVGIENTIIVDTPDALLVCSLDRAQDVRQLVELLLENDPSVL